MSAPMTAEEIRKRLAAEMRAAENSSMSATAVLGAVLGILDYLSAREREHAELRERVAALEEAVNILDARTGHLAKVADDGR